MASILFYTLIFLNSNVSYSNVRENNSIWIKRYLCTSFFCDTQSLRLCHTLISFWGWLFVNIWILVGRIELLNTNRHAIRRILQCFKRKWVKYSKWGQNGQFRGILQPLGPPRPIRKLKGESTSSPRRAVL